MQTLAQLIKDAVAQYGDTDSVRFRDSYSGRGMYGRECVAIVGSEGACQQIVAQVIKELHGLLHLHFDELVDTLLCSERDSMGRSDIVLYWPGLQLEEV
jgi:hypothetical protein